MSRSNYSKDGDYLNLYRATVERATNGKRGQKFLKGLLKALDEMPVKRLIKDELKDVNGNVCAIGAYCLANKIETESIDYELPEKVGDAVGIAACLAAEIEFENDEALDWGYWNSNPPETPEDRWKRMRRWVSSKIIKEEIDR